MRKTIALFIAALPLAVSPAFALELTYTPPTTTTGGTPIEGSLTGVIHADCGDAQGQFVVADQIVVDGTWTGADITGTCAYTITTITADGDVSAPSNAVVVTYPMLPAATITDLQRVVGGLSVAE